MAFSFNPQAALGSASQGLTGLPVIVGLPSYVNPVPGFVVGVSTTERARTSSTMPGLQITDGDLSMKAARNGGSFTFDFIIGATPAVKSEQIRNLTQAIQTISRIANTLLGGGSLLTSLANTSTSYVATQIQVLNGMKDGFQPIFALNLFMPLNSFSSQSSDLVSAWYIESLDFSKGESEQGCVVTITLKELLQKTSSGSVTSILKNLANSLIGPAVGSSVGALL
jgi:hypothetical protein